MKINKRKRNNAEEEGVGTQHVLWSVELCHCISRRTWALLSAPLVSTIPAWLSWALGLGQLMLLSGVLCCWRERHRHGHQWGEWGQVHGARKGTEADLSCIPCGSEPFSSLERNSLRGKIGCRCSFKCEQESQMGSGFGRSIKMTQLLCLSFLQLGDVFASLNREGIVWCGINLEHVICDPETI